MDKMEAVIGEPRPEVSRYAPRVIRIKIDPEKIGGLIGPKGKNIKRICQETGADVNVDDDGTVSIYSTSEEGLKKAVEDVKRSTASVEVGKEYRGVVKNVLDFGAFVEVLPGKEGLIHISKLADHRVAKVTDVLNVGDEVEVKVTDIDRKGRINLIRKGVKEKSSHEGSRKPRGRKPFRPFRKREENSH